jgi:hypothetical protein
VVKKELKDQMKQDELTSGLEHALAWGTRNRDLIRIGALVFVVLAGAVLAITHFRDQRLREADRALREALTTFESPVAAELAPGSERPAGQVFATAEEKYKTAAAAFEGVARRQVSVPASRNAAASRRAGAVPEPKAPRRSRAGFGFEPPAWPANPPARRPGRQGRRGQPGLATNPPPCARRPLCAARHGVRSAGQARHLPAGVEISGSVYASSRAPIPQAATR